MKKAPPARKPNVAICRKFQGIAEPGNTCLTTPGTCESCPEWARQPIKKTKRVSDHILLLREHLRELGLAYREEVRFHPQRLWRFDFLLTDSKIAIEIDGYFRGRHQAFGKDNDKQNAAIMMGYRVLRFSTQAVLRGRAKSFISEHLRGAALKERE